MKFFIKIWLLAIFSLLLAAPLQAQDDNTEVKNARFYMERGLELYYQSDYGNAIRNFDQVLRLNPRFPDVYQFRGNSYFLLGDFARAEYDYIIAIDRFRLISSTITRPTHQAGELTIVDPGRNVSHQANLAALYNNRGAARLKLGRKTEALSDFDQAQEFDPGLLIAQQNGEFAYSGKVSNVGITDKNGNADRGGYGIGSRVGRGYNQGVDYRYERPVMQNRRPDVRKFREDTEDLREARMREQGEEVEGSSFFKNIFKPKPFVKRKVRGSGKTYRRPTVRRTSQDYLLIEEVKITKSATYVTIKVDNTRGRAFQISVDPVGSLGAFYLTDRTGQNATRYELRDVEGLTFYPRAVEIKKGEEHYFKLEFDPIDDFVGTVHLIEGNKQTKSAWNFYHIFLPE